MGIFAAILMAASLCADCFAVSLCSSVTVREINWKSVARIAVSFAVIHSSLLFAGWAFGNLFVGLVCRISHIIGFLLLLYVGGDMLLEGIREAKGKVSAERNLNSFRNIIISGVATSIDALAVGISQSMAGETFSQFVPLLLSLFIITVATVTAGILGGKTIGNRFGHWAEIAGGLILIGIGITILIR